MSESIENLKEMAENMKFDEIECRTGLEDFKRGYNAGIDAMLQSLISCL